MYDTSINSKDSYLHHILLENAVFSIKLIGVDQKFSFADQIEGTEAVLNFYSYTNRQE